MHYVIRNSCPPKWRFGHPTGHPKLLQLETPLVMPYRCCECLVVFWTRKVASDLTVLKRLQELQNETMIVIEEIIMSNALELVSHNKHAVAVRQDIARLQAQLSDNHDHLQRLHDSLQRHLVNVRGTNYRAIGQWLSFRRRRKRKLLFFIYRVCVFYSFQECCGRRCHWCSRGDQVIMSHWIGWNGIRAGRAYLKNVGRGDIKRLNLVYLYSPAKSDRVIYIKRI